jgi:methyltransferase-like protein
MRKSAQIKVDEKTYTIRELTIRQIIDMKNQYENIGGFQEMVQLFITKCSDITPDSLLDFSFSDMEEIVKAVKEVNGSFFKIPGHLGLQEISDNLLKRIKESLVQDWGKAMEVPQTVQK